MMPSQKPSTMPSQNPTPSPSPSPVLQLNPSTVLLSPTMQTVNVTASEANYTGIITNSSGCSQNYVLVNPPAALGPMAPFAFTFQGAAPGLAPTLTQCAVTFYDQNSQHSAIANVTVTGYTITPKPNAITLSISNPKAMTLSITVSGNYSNQISIYDPDPSAVTLNTTTGTGPTATFQVSITPGYMGGPVSGIQLQISDVYSETKNVIVNIVK